MKVFFVNPPFKAEYGKFSRESRSPAVTKSGALYYPLWLIYAAAYTEANGFDIAFLDAPAKQWGRKESLEYIKSQGERTKLFVIDTSTPSIYSDINFSEELKKYYPDAFILLVGTHPSSTAEETMNAGKMIDGIARKEFDHTVVQLAKAIDSGKDLSIVKGLTYRDGDRLVHNEEVDYIMDLDEIPFASKFIKKYLDPKDYFFAAAHYPSIQIFTGRGCPSRCTFCVYPQTMHGHQYRLRTSQNVVEEFKYIAENFPDVKEVVIEDDTFTVSKKRVMEICKLLQEAKIADRLKWLCNARVNLDLETMVAMKKAGCRLIIPGIESGSQEILNNIKKGTNLEQIENYVKNAKRAGILIHACYMVGNKGETKETMGRTLQLALKLNTDTAQFFPLIPYPGTEAYQWARENQYIKEGYEHYCKEDGTHNCVLELPGLSAKEMVEFCDYARKKYYLRVSYVMHRLAVGIRDPQDLKRSIKAFKTLKRYIFRGR